MLTKSAGSADTMKISLMIVGNIQIHNQINVLCINSTRRLKYAQHNHSVKCWDTIKCFVRYKEGHPSSLQRNRQNSHQRLCLGDTNNF